MPSRYDRANRDEQGPEGVKVPSGPCAGAAPVVSYSAATSVRVPTGSRFPAKVRRLSTNATPAEPEIRVTPERMTGAQAVVRSLEELGVTDVFGLPGGAILSVYDPLVSSSLRHILVRHEQGAGHAAEGYALATGKVGVCIATSGPGATNLVTALMDAHMDSVPLVAITGQVASTGIGTDAFQEADIVGITMPITKHSYLLTDATQIPRVLAEAFYLASTGRPGPVLVDITKDAQQSDIDFLWPPTMDLPGYHPVLRGHPKQVRAAAGLIRAASKPVLYVGGGVIRAGASEELRQLAEESGIPLVTTLTARGAFPDSHPQHLGMPGMHGSVAAVAALQQADVIVALGARFDDRVTGMLPSFAPQAQVVHVDIDPAEISKNRLADIPVVGSLKQILPELLATLRSHGPGEHDMQPWWNFLRNLQKTYPLGWGEASDGSPPAPHVIQRIGQLTGPSGVYVTGVGQHQMWASQFLTCERPGSFLSSSGAGTMGFAVPAAMGAKLGHPERTVWAIDGDGCFQMTNQELATCRINDIPIKVAIINNSSLGMVRQWQTLFYQGRYSHTDLNDHGHGVPVPDFVRIAEAYDCVGLRCNRTEDIDATIRAALEVNDRPVVVDFMVSPDNLVWPMVPSGVSNDSIHVSHDLIPEWDRMWEEGH